MLLLLLACTGSPKPIDTSEPVDTADTAPDTWPQPVDADGDGWTEADGDCDDADPERYPERLEDCDGDDDNCDERIDEGHGDSDVDGTADCLDLEECDGLDNDGDALVDEDAPDADGDGVPDCLSVELCDGVDNTGDGVVDEGFDADGDGFASCADCDDADATVYPGAAEPDDGRDHDCDGLADDDTWAPGDLALLEVMANPQDMADPDGEWIEVVNTTDRTLQLDGLSVWSVAGEAVLTDAGSLGPGERLVLGGSEQDWIDVVWEGVSLSNETGSVEIYAGTVLLDALAWDDGVTLPDVAGASLSLDPWFDDAGENDALDRWCAATVPWGRDGSDAGSPGATNESCTTFDHDGDGFSLDGGDCDDADPAVGPGNEDTWYDGVDTDCDGWSDYDADRDGYDGDRWAGTDCDDADATANPGAAEVCDAADVDEDCDGAADDADDAPTVTSTRYADTDGDGYGDPDVSAEWCDPPVDQVASDADCDDARVDVNPDVAEICANGRDDNCDGNSNGCGPGGRVDLPDTSYALLGEAANDEAGLGVDFAGDVDGDGIGDIVVGAYASDRGARDAGAAYLVLGPVGGDLSLADADLILTGEAEDDYAGAEVDGIGDYDGDGTPDLLVGAHQDDDGGANAGAAYVVSGLSRGVVSLSTATAKLIGENARDMAGAEGVALGDIDGDGLADVAVGAQYGDAGGVNAGVVYLVRGGGSGSIDLSTATDTLVGEDRDDDAGAVVASAGDVDGDGVTDLLVGAADDDDAAADAGAVYLVYLPVSGSLELSAADAKLTGARASDHLALGAGPGDLDGDGTADIAVGSGSAGRNGVTYVFTTIPSGSVSADDADVVVLGERSGDSAASGLAGAGDIDGDGDRELLIGSSGADEGDTDAGGVYVWSGPVVAGSYSLADAEIAWWGRTRADELGVSLAGGTDVDGDGFDDVLVGSRSDDEAAATAGAAFLVYGGVGW